MARAFSVYDVLSSNRDVTEFSGEWAEVIGHPELRGCWIVWGQSFNGKTSFTMKLCKYLCEFDKVIYNSLEEGVSRTMQIALERFKMKDVARRFTVLDGEVMEDLKLRLSKRKSANIIIIDSIQYAQFSYADYKQLKKCFPNKLFIFVSHAEGNLPEGRLANKIRYDAPVKIHVEGYRAFINSRYCEATERYITIWNEGASRYWGEKENDNNK